MLVIHTTCGPYIRTSHRDTINEFTDLCNESIANNKPFLKIYGNYLSNPPKTICINLNTIVSIERE